MLPPPDPQLIGWWKVQSIAMPRGKTLGLIGGIPGEKVCFSESGSYHVHPYDSGTQHYRCTVGQPHRELDMWIERLEALTSLCLYTIDDDVLRITVAGRISGRPLRGNPKPIERPTEMRMDDQLNWALFEMKRCKPPRRPATKQGGWKLKPGHLIPDGFLNE